jgi:hypothetical protein
MENLEKWRPGHLKGGLIGSAACEQERGTSCTCAAELKNDNGFDTC